MATVSWVVFKHHKKADGTFNPKIRVYHRGTSAYVATPIFTPFVRFRRGDSTGSITDGDVVDALNSRVKAMRKLLNKYDYLVEECANAKEVVGLLDRKMHGARELDFLCFAGEAVERMPDRGTKLIRRSFLANLQLFTPDGKLPVKQITAAFLARFESWLGNAKPDMRGVRAKGLAASSVQTYMNTFHSLYNQMLQAYNNYETGDIVISSDPFRAYRPTVRPSYAKKSVPMEVIRRVAAYAPGKGGKRMRCLARDMFLLSFCLAGMNLVDIYTCEVIRAGRIEYQRTKTRNKRRDGAFLSIAIPPEAQPLVDQYRDPLGERVFGLYHRMGMEKLRSSVSEGMKKMCRDLELEPFTFYMRRHIAFPYSLKTRNLQRLSA